MRDLLVLPSDSDRQLHLCCAYCRGRVFEIDDLPDRPGIAVDDDLPVDLDIGLSRLYEFLAKDPDAVLTLYGGEPLLKLDLVREIVRNAPVRGFIHHTNGTPPRSPRTRDCQPVRHHSGLHRRARGSH